MSEQLLSRGDKTKSLSILFILSLILGACTNTQDVEGASFKGNIESCMGAVRHLGDNDFTFNFDQVLADPKVGQGLNYLLIDFGKGNDIAEVYPNSSETFRRTYNNIGVFTVSVYLVPVDGTDYTQLCSFKIVSKPPKDVTGIEAIG